MNNKQQPLIVQSYWTKPLFISNDTSCHRIDGGWGSTFVALCAYAYSGLSISKFYPETVLYTDDYGIKIFGEILGIPYANIYTDLNKLDVHPSLWALGKVYTYSLQTRPFIHIDNDIFIWSKLPKSIEEASLCCQNREMLTKDYLKALNMMREDFQTIPSLFHRDPTIQSINAGILGGHNIDFISNYSNLILETYKSYRKEFEYRKLESGYYNIILEQLSFAKLAKEKNERITFLMDGLDFNEIVNQVIDIATVPVTTTYIHLLGNLKKYLSLSQFICHCLKYEYPSYYSKIVNYCKKMGYEIAIPNGNETYELFINRYKKLTSIKNIETFMSDVYYKLPYNTTITKRNNDIIINYLTTGRSLKLSGWSLILSFLSTSKTGNELVKIMHNLLGDTFSIEEISSNVYSFLIRSLFGGNIIEFE